MSYLSELTAHERLTVDNATLDMFTAFENGSDLIYDIWEQYFSDIELSGINVKFAHGVNYPFFFMRCRAVFFKGR